MGRTLAEEVPPKVPVPSAEAEQSGRTTGAREKAANALHHDILVVLEQTPPADGTACEILRNSCTLVSTRISSGTGHLADDLSAAIRGENVALWSPAHQGV
jgi:hypothetical protein